MSNKRPPGGKQASRTLRWSAIFVLLAGCGIVGLSMFSENLWLHELSWALLVIGLPVVLLGLVLLWLDLSLTLNPRTEGNWDHHDKPPLKTRFNQGRLGRASRFLTSRFGDDALFQAPGPEGRQQPQAVPAVSAASAAAGAVEPAAPLAPAPEVMQPASALDRAEASSPALTASAPATANTAPLKAAVEAASTGQGPSATVSAAMPSLHGEGQAAQGAQAALASAIDADAVEALSGPMPETQVLEMAPAAEPAPVVVPAVPAVVPPTSRVLAFRRKGDRRAHDEAAAPVDNTWSDTVIEDHHVLGSSQKPLVSEVKPGPVNSAPAPEPEPDAVDTATFLAQTMDSALARIHGRTGPAEPQPAPQSSDDGTGFADTQPFDFEAEQFDSDAWNAERLNQLDQAQFVSLVEAFYQQAGFVTQQQPSERPHGPVMLWLYSQQRPGQPVSVVRCVHAPGMPLAPIELVTVGHMVQSRRLSRGQLATTCYITAPARALSMVHNINLLDTPAMLSLIAQRSPDQQELLAARSA